MTILVNGPGKFSYGHGSFQNTEAATGGVLKNFPKFKGKHLYQNLFFDKAAGLRPANLFKIKLRHRCFSVNFLKFLRAIFFQANVST